MPGDGGRFRIRIQIMICVAVEIRCRWLAPEPVQIHTKAEETAIDKWSVPAAMLLWNTMFVILFTA